MFHAFQRAGARFAAVTGTVLLASALVLTPVRAAVAFDGQATGIRVSPVTVTLFDGGLQLVPPIPAILPAGLTAAESSLVLDAGLALPVAAFSDSTSLANVAVAPIVSTGILNAASELNAGGDLVGSASVDGLNVLSGALTASVLSATCVADGDSIALSSTIAGLGGSLLGGISVGTAPNTVVPIPGLGQITVNAQSQQAIPGGTQGTVAALRIAIATNLSASAINDVPALAAAVDDILRNTINDELPVPLVLPGGLSLAQIVALLNPVLVGLGGLPINLNGIVSVSASITIAEAVCAQSSGPGGPDGPDGPDGPGGPGGPDGAGGPGEAGGPGSSTLLPDTRLPEQAPTSVLIGLATVAAAALLAVRWQRHRGRSEVGVVRP